MKYKSDQKAVQKKCKVLENIKVSDGFYLIKLSSREICQSAYPGQFVSVLIDEAGVPFLRRPFSFYEISPKKDWFSLLYQIKGKGTERLSAIKEDELLDIIGPLGNGFNVSGKFENIIIVAGGIGGAPLVCLAKELAGQGREVQFLLGARKRSFYNYFKSVLNFLKPGKFLAAVEENFNSAGINVVKILENILKDYLPQAIFACGPMPMIKTLKNLKLDNKIPVFVSLEEHLACSIGVCKGCAIPVLNKKNKTEYMRVCKEGPVFQLKDLVLQ